MTKRALGSKFLKNFLIGTSAITLLSGSAHAVNQNIFANPENYHYRDNYRYTRVSADKDWTYASSPGNYDHVFFTNNNQTISLDSGVITPNLRSVNTYSYSNLTLSVSDNMTIYSITNDPTAATSTRIWLRPRAGTSPVSSLALEFNAPDFYLATHDLVALAPLRYYPAAEVEELGGAQARGLREQGLLFGEMMPDHMAVGGQIAAYANLRITGNMNAVSEVRFTANGKLILDSQGIIVNALISGGNGGGRGSIELKHDATFNGKIGYSLDDEKDNIGILSINDNVTAILKNDTNSEIQLKGRGSRLIIDTTKRDILVESSSAVGMGIYNSRDDANSGDAEGVISIQGSPARKVNINTPVGDSSDRLGRIIIDGGGATSFGDEAFVRDIGLGNNSLSFKDNLRMSKEDGTDRGRLSLGHVNSHVTFDHALDSVITITAISAGNGAVSYNAASIVGEIGTKASPVNTVEFNAPGDYTLTSSIFTQTLLLNRNATFTNTTSTPLTIVSPVINMVDGGDITIPLNWIYSDGSYSILPTAGASSNILGLGVAAGNAKPEAEALDNHETAEPKAAIAASLAPQQHPIDIAAPDPMNAQTNAPAANPVDQTPEVNIFEASAPSPAFAPSPALSIAEIAARATTDAIAQSHGYTSRDKVRTAHMADLHSTPESHAAAMTKAHSQGRHHIPTSHAITNAVTSSVVGHINNTEFDSTTVADVDFGIAAGNEDTTPGTGAWISGLYGKNTQGKLGTVAGYSGSLFGGTLGIDYAVNNGLILGVAYSNVSSIFKWKQDRVGDKTDAKSNVLSFYTQAAIDDHLIWQNVLSLSTSNVRSKNLRAGFIATGKFKSTALAFETNLGYKITSGNMTFVPSLGFRYSGYNDKGYTETGAGVHNQVVGKRASNMLTGILGTKVSWNNRISDNLVLVPALHASVETYFNNKKQMAAAKFIGADSNFESKPGSDTKQARLGYNLGGSITAKQGVAEISAACNMNMTSKKYRSTEGSVKIKVMF